MALNIKVISPYANSATHISVPEDITLKNMFIELVSLGALEKGFVYSGVDKSKGNTPLDSEKSIIDNHISEGDTITVTRKITLDNLHRIRLANEYNEMCQIADEKVLSWTVVKGKEPYVEEYLLNINVKTFISPTELIDSCKIRLSIPKDYPKCPPRFSSEGKTPFHPDFYRDGRWSYGSYDSADGLVSLIDRLTKDLQYYPGYVGYQSPCNREAAEWYFNNKDNTDMFPTDTKELFGYLQY